VSAVPPDLAGRLERFCRARTRDPAARVTQLGPMPGHAGFSYGFVLDRTGAEPEPLVLRLPPPGARAVGPADVVLQARLLRALGRHGIPVPAVRWLGSDPRWFGRPFSVVERLEGASVRLEDPAAAPPAAELAEVALGAAEALARLHRLDWSSVAPFLGPPLEPAEDVTRWDRFLERAAEPGLVALAPTLRSRLLSAAPSRPRTGIFHGDFQWSNLLLDGGSLVAVLDWELAAVGPVLNDLGWLCVFSDPESWAPPFELPAVPPPRDLVSVYEAASGTAVDAVGWYRALAGYKFAIIAALNLGLHRRGKRPDPFYEELAPSVPRLLGRGLELLR
jgi:aminoglycoside phosphotransferase (APT) family kinase protein